MSVPTAGAPHSRLGCPARRVRPRLAIGASLAAGAAVLPALASPEWQLTATPSAAYDSNVANGRGADTLDDEMLGLGVSGGGRLVLSDVDTLRATAELKESRFLRFDALSSLQAGPGISLRHKFGLGYQAPSATISGTFVRRRFFHSRMRDGYSGTAEVIASERLSPSLEASIGAAYDWRTGHSGHTEEISAPATVFTLHGASAFVRAARDITPRLRAGAQVWLRNGDVVVASSRDLPFSFRAEAEDRAFGPTFESYRLGGTTVAGGVKLSWALNSHAAINVAGDVERTYAQHGLSYGGARVSAAYVYQYQ